MSMREYAVYDYGLLLTEETMKALAKKHCEDFTEEDFAEDLYEYEDKDPCDYFEYANPDTLSMSFEGSLNHVLNGYTRGWVKLEEQFGKLFEKYGLYYEMGHAWNLSAYEI